MDTSIFDQYRKQMKDFQQQVLKASTGKLGSENNENKASETWETALNFQKSFINAALKTQETGINMALSAQQNMYNSYFKMLRNSLRINE